MLSLVWLLPALPFASSMLLMLAARGWSRRAVAYTGVGSIAITALITAGIAARFMLDPPEGAMYVQTLWAWMSVNTLHLDISFYLDPLAVVMASVVTGVGFLIHLYSAEYMAEDDSYRRFFAYMNLFIGSMLTLVLANNLVLLYLGWEGVGLCSYLLIGFWYKDPDNGRAARKAFIVTRVGDTAMAIGLFLLFTHLGTLDIQQLMQRASAQWAVGSGLAIASAALLLGGALGKSAQLPLQTWLPDAMAGPTPVSALIHAATMVTAGVYLIARTHVLFSLAPVILAIVAVIGAVTLVMAGFSALTQWDIKRVLAYSTISQIGYMFLALGVGAWSAAIFHLMTHAFFKALLFLGAGAIIQAQHEEHNIFKMGGLRKELPLVFWTFLAAGASLAGFPLVTAGFYSKDMILWEAWNWGDAGKVLWAAGLFGVLLTALYIFRVIVVVFFGEVKVPAAKKPGYRIGIPLATLALLSVIGGLVEIPPTLGDHPFFSHFVSPTFGEAAAAAGGITLQIGLQTLAGCLVLAGIFLAWYWFGRRPAEEVETRGLPFVPASLNQFWFEDWGYDRLYDLVFVRPFVYIAEVNKADFIDSFYSFIARVARVANRLAGVTQSGRLRWYAASLAIGVVLIVSMVIFL